MGGGKEKAPETGPGLDITRRERRGSVTHADKWDQILALGAYAALSASAIDIARCPTFTIVTVMMSSSIVYKMR
jgi:hypothetical protein